MNDQQAPLSDQMVDHVFDNLDRGLLSEWESEFVKSAHAWWKGHRRLSDKQRAKLKNLWEDRHNAKRVYRNAQKGQTS